MPPPGLRCAFSGGPSALVPAVSSGLGTAVCIEAPASAEVGLVPIRLVVVTESARACSYSLS